MKNLLLASTALVLSAGLAHAQAVTITGDARMGIQYSAAGFAPGAQSWRAEQRLQLNFNVSVQADHGLSFGAWTRARMQTTSWHTAASGAFSPSRVWVEANGFRLTFGNQDGAIQTAGLVGAATVGYTGGNFAGGSASMYTATQGQTSTAPAAGANNRVGVHYTMGDIRVGLTHDRAGAGGVGLSATEIGVRGTFGAFSVAAGYANRRANPAGIYLANTSIATISGAYNGGSWTVGLVAARLEGLGTNYALTGSAQLGGGTATAYVGRNIDGVPATSDTAYGIGYSYGLGGGARVALGAERLNGVTTAEVGVAFNF